MYKQVEKSKEDKSRSVANSIGQKKNNVEQYLGFKDNRKDVSVQRKLQEKPESYSENSSDSLLSANPSRPLQLGKKSGNVSSDYKYGTKNDDTHIHAYNKEGGHVKLNGHVFKYGTSGDEMAAAEIFFLANQGQGGLLGKTQQQRVKILKWIRDWK